MKKKPKLPTPEEVAKKSAQVLDGIDNYCLCVGRLTVNVPKRLGNPMTDVVDAIAAIIREDRTRCARYRKKQEVSNV